MSQRQQDARPPARRQGFAAAKQRACSATHRVRFRFCLHAAARVAARLTNATWSNRRMRHTSTSDRSRPVRLATGHHGASDTPSDGGRWRCVMPGRLGDPVHCCIREDRVAPALPGSPVSHPSRDRPGTRRSKPHFALEDLRHAGARSALTRPLCRPSERRARRPRVRPALARVRSRCPRRRAGARPGGPHSSGVRVKRDPTVGAVTVSDAAARASRWFRSRGGGSRASARGGVRCGLVVVMTGRAVGRSAPSSGAVA